MKKILFFFFISHIFYMICSEEVTTNIFVEIQLPDCWNDAPYYRKRYANIALITQADHPNGSDIVWGKHRKKGEIAWKYKNLKNKKENDELIQATQTAIKSLEELKRDNPKQSKFVVKL